MPVQLEDGYTKIANKIIEQLCTTDISQYEWRVLMAIFRKTYGYNKKSDWIANSQLVELTKIHKSHVSRAIRKLIKRGIVAQTGNKLSFNKDFSSWLPKEVTNKKLPKQATLLPKEATLLPKEATIVAYRGVHKRKKTIIQKTIIQKKDPKNKKISNYSSLNDLKEKDFEEIANDYKVPLAFVLSELDTMKNWLGAKGKKYKNYKLALRNWVKNDAIKRIDYAKQNNIKRGADLSHL